MGTILAGDIGGTNTRLALFDETRLTEPAFLRVYSSGDYESFLRIVERFLEEAQAAMPETAPTCAGFGVAGPVDGSIVRLTNLPWVMDGDALRERLAGKPVTIVNDFSAICHAVPHLEPRHLRQIGGGKPQAQAPIAVLGAGTGLGEGFIVWHDGTYQVIPSEGGHADFAPRNPLEIRALEYLTEKYRRVSYERILSGPGLVNLYEFFRDREGMAEAPAVREEMRHEAAPPVISRHGMARSDPLCERALELFCTIYGAEAGNLALKLLARGGVYLAGGIAAKILPMLEAGGFRHGFESKGRYRDFLESVPTYVIMHEQPGLMGAAIAARMQSGAEAAAPVQP